jgi:hypothetical protein
MTLKNLQDTKKRKPMPIFLPISNGEFVKGSVNVFSEPMGNFMEGKILVKNITTTVGQKFS